MFAEVTLQGALLAFWASLGVFHARLCVIFAHLLQAVCGRALLLSRFSVLR